ncbi:hypothetical protein SAMN04488518_11774 [Pseudovibrio ascidiaceicola]|uniref:DUF4440 domain-containing protein n=1 Tax=Pseudovibrio ascidiaceicola TaxID=285279 RepID=A0A1I4F3V1_9HYPH|nr:nuclear transport factor 2 family protein [Pseudovibrio ascidiaceicola]SFL12655.1 hypothetical protein SAMN04488518_11774 [Pseudovibrio ascidiaceicola]
MLNVKINYFQYVRRFSITYVLMLAIIFVYGMIIAQIFDAQISFWRAAWTMGPVSSFLLGYKIYERQKVRLNIDSVLGLAVLCFLSLLSVQAILSYASMFNLLGQRAPQGLIIKFGASWAISQFGLILAGLWFGGWVTEKFKDDKQFDFTALESNLLSLEQRLLDPAVRGSRHLLDQLLHADFIEIGASGRTYDRAQVLDALPTEAADYPVRTIENFRLRELSEGLIQVFYSIAENATQRTSIWKLEDEQWSMIYHQGTRRAP